MTPHERAAAELDAATEALEGISALASDGRERFENEPDRRAHLCYLWIVVAAA